MLMLDVGWWMLDVRCWMLDGGRWMLDLKCWVLGVGDWKHGPQKYPDFAPAHPEKIKSKNRIW